MIQPSPLEHDSEVSNRDALTDMDTRIELLLRLANLVVLQERTRRSVMELTGQKHPSSFTSDEWDQSVKLLATNGNSGRLRPLRVA